MNGFRPGPAVVQGHASFNQERIRSILRNGTVGNPFEDEADRAGMTPKAILASALLCALALAGCTGGDDGGGGTSTSTSGTGGAGACVTANPAGGGCVNATASGSATGTSTGSNSTSGTSAPMTASVNLTGSQFSPGSVTIKVGGTVTWTHKDGTLRHTVTSDDGSFDSHPQCTNPVTPLSDCMDNGETFTQTFAKDGTFAYHCKIHSGMTGTVTVVA